MLSSSLSRPIQQSMNCRNCWLYWIRNQFVIENILNWRNIVDLLLFRIHSSVSSLRFTLPSSFDGNPEHCASTTVLRSHPYPFETVSVDVVGTASTIVIQVGANCEASCSQICVARSAIGVDMWLRWQSTRLNRSYIYRSVCECPPCFTAIATVCRTCWRLINWRGED